MAYRDLTYNEFRAMTEKEKYDAYQHLSDKDKLRVRICMPNEQTNEVPCNKCANRIKNTPCCKAFPQGISAEQMHRVMDDQTYECGNGYRFECEVNV